MPSSQQPPAVGDLPPPRTARDRCWKARDAYYACLDQHNLWLHGLAEPSTHKERISMDPTKPPVKNESDRSLSRAEKNSLFTCKEAKEMFDKDCLKSWVQHFSSLRVKDKQIKAMADQVKANEEARHTNKEEFWARMQK